MKIIIESPKQNILNGLRRVGYAFLRKDDQTGESSFVKRVGGGDYPRFHIYAKTVNGRVAVNLHIDQKKASYSGTTAHSGEYEIEDNEWIAREAEVIKKAFSE